MPSPEPFLVFTRKFNELGLRYMVSGSVAAIFYGEPRLTNDVDVIVFLKRSDLPRLEMAFSADEFYCPPLEVLQVEAGREQRGHFNLIHHDTGFKADIYLCGQDALHQWGLAHVRRVEVGEDFLFLAPPEYVIVRKLQFFREGHSPKHLRDISRMLLAFGPEWNRQPLEDMVRQAGLQQEWAEALARLELE